MESNIYICRKSKLTSNYFFELIKGEKYIIESWIIDHAYNLLAYKVIRFNDYTVVKSAANWEFINEYFYRLEDTREDKLNKLLNES